MKNTNKYQIDFEVVIFNIPKGGEKNEEIILEYKIKANNYLLSLLENIENGLAHNKQDTVKANFFNKDFEVKVEEIKKNGTTFSILVSNVSNESLFENLISNRVSSEPSALKTSVIGLDGKVISGICITGFTPI